MDTLKRRSIRVALLAAPLVLLGAMADGHGGDSKLIHACVEKRHGDVRIVGAREHCRRHEHALHWVREVPKPAPAPVPAPAPTGATAAELVDAGDVVLGPVVSVGSGNLPVVGIRRNGRLFPFIAANPEMGFATLSGFDTLYFSEAGCQGDRFLVRSGSPFPATAIDQAGNGFGDAGGNPVPGGADLGSSFSWDGCQPIDVVQNPAPAAVVPAVQVFASGDFTPPFRVR
jgi:hypothetical protein